MTNYISLAELAEKPGAVELAQITTQSGQQMTPPPLLDLMLRGEDTSSYQPDELARANNSILRINEAVQDSQSLINGYLRQRGYKLPFPRIPRLLTTWSRAITRYYLHQHRQSEDKSDPIVRDYKDALALLRQVADGKLSLGIEDTIPAGGGKPLINTPGRIFNAQTLKDYGRE